MYERERGGGARRDNRGGGTVDDRTVARMSTNRFGANKSREESQWVPFARFERANQSSSNGMCSMINDADIFNVIAHFKVRIFCRSSLFMFFDQDGE